MPGMCTIRSIYNVVGWVCSASMLQYLRVIPVDGMVLVFSYGFSDTSVLMLLHMCLESACSLVDVHLSAGARYFVDNICLLLAEHCSDVEVLTYPLTHASYVREVDSGWPTLPRRAPLEAWQQRQNG